MNGFLLFGLLESLSNICLLSIFHPLSPWRQHYSIYFHVTPLVNPSSYFLSASGLFNLTQNLWVLLYCHKWHVNLHYFTVCFHKLIFSFCTLKKLNLWSNNQHEVLFIIITWYPLKNMLFITFTKIHNIMQNIFQHHVDAT